MVMAENFGVASCELLWEALSAMFELSESQLEKIEVELREPPFGLLAVFTVQVKGSNLEAIATVELKYSFDNWIGEKVVLTHMSGEIEIHVFTYFPKEPDSSTVSNQEYKQKWAAAVAA